MFGFCPTPLGSADTAPQSQTFWLKMLINQNSFNILKELLITCTGFLMDFLHEQIARFGGHPNFGELVLH